MKDPDSVRRNNSKIKIVVSFNGTFRRRPPDGRLRYTGGESKIISVDRSISFSRLNARIFDLMVEPNGAASATSAAAFSLRYHLPDSQEDRPLVPVSSDDDVSSMFHEFVRLDFLGKPTRLWVFVCFDDLNSPPDFNGIPLKKSMNGKNNGFGGEKGKKLSDNSLRKLVLKQQLLGKKSDRVRVLKGEIGNKELAFPVVDISSTNCYGQFGPRDTTRSLGILHKPHQELLCGMEDFHNFGLLDNERPYNVVEWENLECGPLKDTLEDTILASMADVSFKNVSLSSSPSTKFEQKISPPSRMEDECPPLERSPQASSASHKAMDPIVDKFPISLSCCDEQGENTETNKCARANNGTILADGGLCCTHVGNGGLQRINRYELEYVKELGCGTYGTVYYGKWKGSDVAIKRLKPSCFAHGTMEDRLIADFWKEARILGSLHHPNIVALYGVVTDGLKNNLETVTEYMVNGSLKQVLRKRDGTIDYRKRLLIALDAAFGLEYLHQKNVIHFDLKSHFLVNMRDPQRPICKIGDLGLSKIRQRTLVSGGVRGTLPWMAPELLNGESMVSEKVDVYSFGIVMWELLTGAEPYSNMRAEEVICGIMKGSLRPEIPNWCQPGWRYLMERCWASDPKERPAFSDIARELRAMASSMNII